MALSIKPNDNLSGNLNNLWNSSELAGDARRIIAAGNQAEAVTNQKFHIFSTQEAAAEQALSSSRGFRA